MSISRFATYLFCLPGLFLAACADLQKLQELMPTTVSSTSCTGGKCSQESHVVGKSQVSQANTCGGLYLWPGYLCFNDQEQLKAAYATRVGAADATLAYLEQSRSFRMGNEFARKDYLNTHRRELSPLIDKAQGAKNACYVSRAGLSEYDFQNKKFEVRMSPFAFNPRDYDAVTLIGAAFRPARAIGELKLSEPRARVLVGADDSHTIYVRYCGAIGGVHPDVANQAFVEINVEEAIAFSKSGDELAFVTFVGEPGKR